MLNQLRQQGLDRVLPVPCGQILRGRHLLAATAPSDEPGRPGALLQTSYTNLAFVLIFQTPEAARSGAQMAYQISFGAAFSVRPCYGSWRSMRFAKLQLLLLLLHF